MTELHVHVHNVIVITMVTGFLPSLWRVWELVSYKDRDDDDMATESVNLSLYILLVASRLCGISSNIRMHIHVVHYNVSFYVWLLW